MNISRLFIYPVKSLGGMEVAEVEIDQMGFVGDRRFMVVDQDGLFITQRTVPRMALIAARLRGDFLELAAPGQRSTLNVQRSTLNEPSEIVRVTIWKSRDLPAEYCGDEAATWLSSFLGSNCRLVRIGSAFRRVVAGSDLDQVSFADGQPALVISEASLALLNEKLQSSVHGHRPTDLGWDRFRPNIVVGGCAAHEEDAWIRVKIGETTWRADGPCARCPIPTTNQQTAERGPEPLRTLATYRRDPNEPGAVYFGQNLINESKSGIIRVGDRIESS